MSTYVCDLNTLNTMVEKLRLAKQNNDISQIKELEKSIQEFRKSCGSPYSDAEIKAMTNTDLDETDRAFLREAPLLVIRNLEQQNLEGAMTILNGAKAYLKHERMPEGFRGMLDALIERTADKELTDFQIILGKNFRPDEPALHAKATAYQQQPQITFFKYHTKPEYPQKTNQEIQQEMKKENEQ